jgi:hypothetical protein
MRIRVIIKNCVLALKERGPAPENFYIILSCKIDEELKYCRSVLQPIVVAAAKALASRVLSCRGSIDYFGCISDGNFVMALELTAEFDP